VKKLPVRKRLAHDVPLWVDPAKECYFITICCKARGRNQLALPDIAKALFETARHRNDIGVWYVHVALLMPDHLHVLVSFPEVGKRIQAIISKWKEWTSKTVGISWHRDFFEHRLREDESFREKAEYILLNPVRAGLIEKSENWPYVFIADSW
jgi:REP-associated tyrosine transposase